MSLGPPTHETQSPAVEAFFLGRVHYARCLALQERLLAEATARDDGQIVLLVCEHPNVVTVGRGGSPGDLASESGLLRTRQIEVRWVGRGGGTMLHCPGQVAIYPIVPLQWHDFTVGEYLERLQSGVIEALADLNIPAHTLPGQHGIWGRTGQLAAIGAAVRGWITWHGAYLNVAPSMGLFRLVEAGRAGQPPMSCLAAERRGPVRMTAVRAALVNRLVAALGCQRYHLYTGHPWLRGRIAE